MNKFLWKKKIALAEQLKFFGASKVDFISVYAKKPRVLCKAKDKPKEQSEFLQGGPVLNARLADARESALYQQQMTLGIQNSARGFIQMAGLQQANAQMNFNSYPSGLNQQKLGQSLFGSLLGGNL